MDKPIFKWRKAKVKFLTRIPYEITDLGGSTRGCQIINQDDIKEIYFEDYDKCQEEGRHMLIVHLTYGEIACCSTHEVEILELNEPEEFHPFVKIMARKRSKNIMSNTQITQTVENMLTQISEIFSTDVFPTLAFSQSTKQWYVTTLVQVWAKAPNDLECSVLEHRPTMIEAVEAYIQVLKDAEYFYTTNKHSNVKIGLWIYKWDGNKFTKTKQTNIDELTEFIKESKDIEQMLNHIDSIQNFTLPGHMLTRVHMDRELLQQRGITLPPYVQQDKEAYFVWCAAIGNMFGVKDFFYGWTMLEAVQKAAKHYMNVI